MNAVPWTAGLGAAMGGISAAGNGGDVHDIGQSAGLGALMGAAGLARPALGIAGALGSAIPGMMSVRGDVDAAARKILAAAQGDPNKIERAADILYGGEPTRSEMGYGRYGRGNAYGVSSSDQVGVGAIGVERDAAVQRAYQMLGGD